MLKPIYIFDLDGTISINKHREHYIKCEKPDWEGFFNACDKDIPNYPVIEVLKSLRKTSEIWIWSGRSDAVREKTLDWLMDYKIIDCRNYSHFFNNPNRFRMRKSGDFTPDEVLKKNWLDGLSFFELIRLVGVFDDRDKVVKMWRYNGIACFQVADGNF